MCGIRTTTMDLNSILNIADMRFVSNGLLDMLKSCLSRRRLECRAWKQGYQNCFRVAMSRGTSLARITADGMVTDYIKPSHSKSFRYPQNYTVSLKAMRCSKTRSISIFLFRDFWRSCLPFQVLMSWYTTDESGKSDIHYWKNTIYIRTVKSH